MKFAIIAAGEGSRLSNEGACAPKPLIKINGEYALDILYREVPADLLSTQIDTCWVNVGGENPAEYIRKYAGRVEIVHLKDFTGGKSENMYALIGIDDDSKRYIEDAALKQEIGSEEDGAQYGSLTDATKAILEYVNRRVNKQSTLARIEMLTEPFKKTATQKIRRFLYMAPSHA